MFIVVQEVQDDQPKLFKRSKTTAKHYEMDEK